MSETASSTNLATSNSPSASFPARFKRAVEEGFRLVRVRARFPA